MQLIIFSISLVQAAQDLALAAIEICPYSDNPKLYNYNPEFSEKRREMLEGLYGYDPGQHNRRYLNSKGEPNEYNLGETFLYLTKEEAESKYEAQTYMDQFAPYFKAFNEEQGSQKGDRNVLFVRMLIIISGHQVLADYLFGVFVSGGDEYKCGSIKHIISSEKLHVPLPVSIKSIMERDSLYRLLKDQRMVDSLKKYSSVSGELLDMAKMLFDKKKTPVEQPLEQKESLSEEEVIEAVISGDIYNTSIFEVESVGKKLVPISNLPFGDIKALKDGIAERIFTTKEAKAGKKKGKHPKSEIEDQHDSLRKALLTNALYGQPCYLGDNSCFGNQSKMAGIYFNQSEQAYISWLKRAGSGQGRPIVELQQNFVQKTQPLDSYNATPYNIEEAQIHLYSYLDICRYGRGTMACMLGNGEMTVLLNDFFTQGLKIKLSEGGVKNVRIFAFSCKGTDV